MRYSTIFSRGHRGRWAQSQGIYTNLWPTNTCRIDRQTLEGWYLSIQVGSWRLEFLG